MPGNIMKINRSWRTSLWDGGILLCCRNDSLFLFLFLFPPFSPSVKMNHAPVPVTRQEEKKTQGEIGGNNIPCKWIQTRWLARANPSRRALLFHPLSRPLAYPSFSFFFYLLCERRKSARNETHSYSVVVDKQARSKNIKYLLVYKHDIYSRVVLKKKMELVIESTSFWLVANL